MAGGNRSVSICIIWLVNNSLSTQTESPQIVSVNATSSTSLLVSWDRPNLDEMDGTLETFSVSCSPDEGNTVDAPADSLSAGLFDLSPYTTYTCCVTAHTTAGMSGASCGSQTTLEDGVSVNVFALFPVIILQLHNCTLKSLNVFFSVIKCFDGNPIHNVGLYQHMLVWIVIGNVEVLNNFCNTYHILFTIE